jgi:hypothetical protein
VSTASLVRRSVATFAGLAGVFAGLTLLFLTSRAVTAPQALPETGASTARGRVLEVLDAGRTNAPSRPVKTDPAELASALERMSQLHAQGKLSDAELTSAKERLLGTGSSGEGR